MNASLPPRADGSESEAPDGLVALAGAAVTGLVLALGFVALMARVGGPAPVQASVVPPVGAVMGLSAPDTPPATRPLYDDDETGAH